MRRPLACIDHDGGEGAHPPSRPRNTYVPSCRPTQRRRARVGVRQLVPGSGEGQRMERVEVEREGCPIKRRSLPGVGVHDAGASSQGHVRRLSVGIAIGLHPAWRELDVGLTPLLRYDFENRWRSKAVFLFSMK